MGDFGLGFSFTMPALEIGTSSVLGLEFPSSANVKRPRLAGIGISGDATKIWSILSGQPTVVEDAVTDSVDTPELSVSVGIGYVGIIGGKNANWFKAFGQIESSKPARIVAVMSSAASLQRLAQRLVALKDLRLWL